jgi:hypothetical protein
MAVTFTYLNDATLEGMTDEALQTAKRQAQVVSQMRFGVMLGTLSNARGQVRRINKILKARGLTAEGTRFVKDQSGLVAAAVAPLQEAALAQAEKNAEEYVASILAKYAGQNINVVAPRPTARMHTKDYNRAQSFRNALEQLMTAVYGPYTSYYAQDDAPRYLIADSKKIEKFIKDELEAAGSSFILYVAKLEEKVGEGVTAASVEGRLWTGSVLTVKKGDVTERWHTQQIINRSSLGNAFNQWPTRKMK